MKVLRKMFLHTTVVFLFSIGSLIGLEAAQAPEKIYEDMITNALAQPNLDDRIKALNSFVLSTGSLSKKIVAEINPEFSTALNAIYQQAHADITKKGALQTLLDNAKKSILLTSDQKENAGMWISALTDVAAPTPVTPKPAIIQAPALIPDMPTRIAALEKEPNLSKKLEGIYALIQDAQGKTISDNVHKSFGNLFVSTVNAGIEAYSYLSQIAHIVVDVKTPLLTPKQLEHVKKNILPLLAQQKEQKPQAAPAQPTKSVTPSSKAIAPKTQATGSSSKKPSKKSSSTVNSKSKPVQSKQVASQTPSKKQPPVVAAPKIIPVQPQKTVTAQKKKPQDKKNLK